MPIATDCHRRRFLIGLAASSLTFLPFLAPPSLGQEKPVTIPPPEMDLEEDRDIAVAILAGGCFWGIQGVFQRVKGVKSAVSGYSGGLAETATYEQTSRGDTGHAEAVEVSYDPREISFGALLHIYFSVAHNPTQLNYQGPDRGPQYRSAIFVRGKVQEDVARAYIAQLDASKLFEAPIVTSLEPFEAFYPAEQYHQDFLTLNPDWPYIVVHDMPKIAALERLFPQRFRADPVLVGSLPSG
ncbi:peptide-methionine (S)-S-oxide reductase MsrA [Devosia sp. YIM 151766]|uniref:peptide-methionine (S)-S-oxide reductase MsrA n=1 Tax=Devosia sp. YIM 151766 TaxID=3017325 RepID=UPI00255C99DF|nr:peptide-methionine (S)-S-oxide reductase MsrA [Devosia sp. YIM 151766]WIY54434.1 peptide-methionine (S)-S-oxide reductase MsrA [Devosia sp. YIM 151766]